MGWASKIVEKLPTLRGVGTFIYVATNWNTISSDLEGYRRQIKDREEWAKTALDQKDKLHEMAQEQLRREVDTWRTRAERAIEMAGKVLDTTKDISEVSRAALNASNELTENIIGAWADASLLLARLLQREGPLTQVLLLNSLNDLPRRLVQRMLAALPPPPAAPPLNLPDLKPPPSVGGMDVR